MVFRHKKTASHITGRSISANGLCTPNRWTDFFPPASAPRVSRYKVTHPPRPDMYLRIHIHQAPCRTTGRHIGIAPGSQARQPPFSASGERTSTASIYCALAHSSSKTDRFKLPDAQQKPPRPAHRRTGRKSVSTLPSAYSCGPAGTRALPASLSSYLTKFFWKREARSLALVSHSEASA